MKSLLSVLVILCISFNFNTANAVTYIPITFDKLMNETQAMAEVVLISKRSYKSALGLINTEYTFEVRESAGLENYLNSTNLLSFSMIGGTVDGLTTYIDGAPEFKEGEESFLLLKIFNGSIYLSNLGVGKFKIVRKGEEVFYENTIFPKDKDLGLVSKERMFGGLKTDQAQKQLEYTKSSYKNHKKELKDNLRAPAQEESVSKSPVLITSFIFAWIALMVIVMFRRKKSSIINEK